ncbi:MAG: tetratricopeptide repeat protein [Bryobacteraceae bacterium]|nr:tetratricopeptide repeat protein [Bryobacteraceae bacterium]
MKKTPKATANNPAPAAVPTNGKEHTDLFARAMKLFHGGKFADAQHLFELCAQGPEITVKESAQMYVRMCTQRMAKADVVLKTAEDYYTYAVSLMNLQKYSDALPHLQKAVKLGDGAHVRYALALASGLMGDMPGAVAHLQQAISLDPATRGLARSDNDFQPLLQDSVIRELITGQRG